MINYNFEKRRLKNISNVLLLNKKIDPKKILIDVKRISLNEDVDADLKNAEQQFKLISTKFIWLFNQSKAVKLELQLYGNYSELYV